MQLEKMGASSDSGAFQHCQDQNCISNIANLAKKFREKNLPVIHIHFITDPGAPGMTTNAPLFCYVKILQLTLGEPWGLTRLMD